MIKLQINVSKDDIKWGKIGNDKHCPIAKAIKRLIPKGVSVDPCFCTAGGRDFILPDKAVQFILDFDTGKPVESFKFIMREY